MIFFLLIPSACLADVFVVYNSTTKEILSVSDRADAVVPQGYSTEVIKGSASDFPSDMSDYIFENKKIKLNIAKITEKQDKKIEEQKISDDKELVKKKMMRMACDELIKEGIQLKKIKCEDLEK
jgi:hypothetical protein